MTVSLVFFFQNASFVSASLNIGLLKCMGNNVNCNFRISENIYQAFLVMLRDCSVHRIFGVSSRYK